MARDLGGRGSACPCVRVRRVRVVMYELRDTSTESRMPLKDAELPQ